MSSRSHLVFVHKKQKPKKKRSFYEGLFDTRTPLKTVGNNSRCTTDICSVDSDDIRENKSAVIFIILFIVRLTRRGLNEKYFKLVQCFILLPTIPKVLVGNYRETVAVPYFAFEITIFLFHALLVYFNKKKMLVLFLFGYYIKMGFFLCLNRKPDGFYRSSTPAFINMLKDFYL